LLLAALLSLNAPGGPTDETTGVVEAIYFPPTNVGAPVQHVSVRLKDGTLVQARVVTAPATLKPGQAAQVRVYRHLITRTLSYEAAAAEANK